MTFTIGSLFDGSAGFPLAATLCGGHPVWASEIEPYPIAVTRSRFPSMKHLGSVTDIDGGAIEPVDVITFGSPCQDLSVAGKRAGLKHEDNGDEETTRSGLFMEAVRIIKEMRDATNGKYPRIALWENVPGAFSSNKGEDFRVVLEELIKVVEPTAVMPEVPKKGWAYADTYSGDGWSLAYRVFDAQFWGVPQRRRRIYLVADFAGECARQILFEREGLRRYFTSGRTPGQGTSSHVESGIGAKHRACFPINTMVAMRNKADDGKTTFGVGEDGDPQFTISAAHSHAVACEREERLVGMDGYNACLTGDVSSTLGINCGTTTGRNGVLVLNDQGGQQIDVREDGISPTLRAEMHGHPPCVLEVSAGFVPNMGAKARGIGYEPERATTLSAERKDAVVISFEPGIARRNGAKNRFSEEVCSTLRANMGDNQPAVAYGTKTLCIKGNAIDRETRQNGGFCRENVSYTLDATDRHGVCYLSSCYDARGNGDGDIAPTLTGDHQRCITDYTGVVVGTAVFGKGTRPHNKEEAQKWHKAHVANTLNAFDSGEARANELVVETATGKTLCMATQQGGAEILEEKCPTITAAAGMSGNNQPVLCMAHGQANAEICENLSPTLSCNHEQPIVFDKEVYNSGENATGGHYIAENGPSPALRATGHPPGVCKQYIVRRLTPTECARLQGFPDEWGHFPKKENFTDEEYTFWQEVRNTHAAINGKTVKDYTKAQMLTWYNRLHTDSAEYKMWGNGIALPTALYVMQGIEEVLCHAQD